ncbi:sulfatase [Pelagicoccus mobilis]|uniref:Sulfatase n=1 Tax=Pelagicoccus mobilis TaxID=415221 RepID=A0A934VKB8_9BACT|nr:sulfatase [Pelagicoccus mobilis]MBK1876501.1 sulfatase [Pelagicoccus mobilis]
MLKRTPFALAAAFLASCLNSQAGAEERPNVLFIVCDDLNTQVGPSGYENTHTPVMDKLARTGMTFTRAYCQYPVCGPSRASFLHSLYPESTGVISNRADIDDTRPGTISMPQLFRNAGYWTAATGKIFHIPREEAQEQRWDEHIRFENDEMPMVTPIREAFEKEHGSVDLPKNKKLWKETYFNIATQTRDQNIGYGPSGLTDEQHKDGKNARKVVSWLEEQSYGDQPFFIAMGIQKPHVPYLAPDKYFEHYPKEGLEYVLPPSDFWDQAPRTARDSRFEAFGFELGKENSDLRRDYMQSYHACITFLDAQLGLVLDALEETGQADNTIVVFTSDHGYQLGEHFLWGKVSLFDICDRVPFIVRAPGMTTAGSSSEGLVELIDIYPTLADLCSIEIPDHVQGKSIVPMLEDPSVAGKDVSYTVVARGKNLGKAVRTQRWRYSKWIDGEELYDLENDFHEHKNLANSPEYAPVMKAMRYRLEIMEAFAASKAAPES